MKIDFARFGAWLQIKLDRLRATQLTVGGVVGTGVVLGCFFVITLWPVIRSEKLDWHTWDNGWSKAIKLSWLPLFAALYLKYSDSIKKTRALDRTIRKRRTSRQIITGQALKQICVNLKSEQISPQDMQSAREGILQAAALGVSEIIGLNTANTVTATLLEFSDARCLKMRVICRSTRERPCQVEYVREDLVAWAAIRDARIKYSDDIGQDQRWSHLGEKPYRSVASIPIGYGGKAFAALSVDCDLPYAFYGRMLDIAIQLEPYAATLALTYGKEAIYHECHYDPHHPA